VKKPKRKTLPSPAKPGQPPPCNLTPGLCNRLRRDLLAACKQVAETHGLTAEGGDLSDIDLRHGFGIQFRVGILARQGAVRRAGAKLWIGAL